MFGKDRVPETGVGIKRAGMLDSVPKEELEARIRTIAHAKRDVVWWAENFFHIITLDKGLTRIQLYPKQRELLNFIADNTRTIVLSARQCGKTTSYTVFCLWYATMFRDKKIMICANKLATAIEIMDRIRKAYENLPFWIKPGILTYNKGEIEFANGSAIRACSTSSSASRGSSANCLIIDEAAFIPKNIIDEFFASVVPIVSSSKTSKIIMVSTPNGASGLYYDLWQKANSKDARANEEGWKPFRINWWETGGIRDENWKAQQIASIGIEKWKQEFECDFLTSATSRMVPDDILEKYRMALSELKASNKEFYLGKTHKIMSENQDKVYEFTMWHEFQEDKTYAASGDVAEGGGGDESVLYIWDISDLKEIKLCAKFSSNQVSPTEFAFITKKILELYGNPYYICERNGLGSGYLDSLRITYGYDNIVREAKNNEIGVISHAMTKSKACLWAKDMMTTAGFSFKLYDKDLIDELGTFCKKDNKGVHLTYCALPNCHDDHVMAFIWLCWLLQSDVIERYYSVYKTFTSALGNVYAELVAPIKPYERSEVKRITNDPIYQDFLDFKAALQNKLGKIIEQEKQAPSDIYFSNQDPYFGGFDSSPSWNTP